MKTTCIRITAVLLCLAITSETGLNAAPSIQSAPELASTTLFTSQALNSPAVWCVAALAITASVYWHQEAGRWLQRAYEGWTQLGQWLFGPASVALVIRWAGLANLRAAVTYSLAQQNSARTTWLMRTPLEGVRPVTDHAYGQRMLMEGYPYLISVEAERALLLRALIARTDGQEKRACQDQLAALIAGKPLSDGSALLGPLRRRMYQIELDNPAENQKWFKAITAINLQLRRIEAKWDPLFRQKLERMILEMESFLPYMNDDFDPNTPKMKYDNYKDFVQDTEHGLLHSLVVIDKSLDLAKRHYEETHPGESSRDFVEEAKGLYAGVGLYHDLTGMRNRDRHHETARDLARHILSHIKTAQGEPVYDNAIIEAVADGCYTHRGQNYPQPSTLLGKIFVDVDEYILVEHIQRIFEQHAESGIFHPRFWHVYRRYMAKERDKFGHTTDAPGHAMEKFKHEMDFADLFQFLLFTMLERTRPENYTTDVAKRMVRESYPQLKEEVQTKIEQLARDQTFATGGTLWENQLAIRQMHRIVIELEALIRDDEKAKMELRQDMGTSSELRERIHLTTQELNQSLVGKETLLKPSIKLHIAFNQKRGLRAPGHGPYMWEYETLRKGLSLFDDYLENPELDLTKPLPSPPSNTNVAYETYAGFAIGIYFAAAERVQDLFLMVEEGTLPEATRETGEELGLALAELFLQRVHDGLSSTEAAELIRQQLATLDYKSEGSAIVTKRQEADETMLKAIRQLPTVNSYIEATGALTFEQIAAVCGRNPRAVRLPSAPPGFRANQATDWRKLAYSESDQSPASEAPPYNLINELLANDNDNFDIHFDWFRQIVINANEQGNRLVAITHRFEGFTSSDPRRFQNAIKGAVHGLGRGEQATDGETKAVLILGVDKTWPFDQIQWIIQKWLEIRSHWLKPFPQDALRLFGIHSQGLEHRDSHFRDVAKLFIDAHEQGQWTKIDIGQQWPAGQLLPALHRIHAVVISHAVDTSNKAHKKAIDQMTNPIALFVDPVTLRPDQYEPGQLQEFIRLQDEIWKEIRDRNISVEVSLTQMELISRQSRREEGWNFRSIKEVIQRYGVSIVIADSDPGVANTQYAEEYLRLHRGVSIFGFVPRRLLNRLLKNSNQLLRHLSDRYPDLKVIAPEWRAHMEIPNRRRFA